MARSLQRSRGKRVASPVGARMPRGSVERVDSVTRQLVSERPQVDIELFQAAAFFTLIGVYLEGEFRSFSQQVLGLGPGDLRVLFALYRTHSKLNPVKLQRALLVTSGAMTKQIARLEAKGLVERSGDKTDKRVWQIQLSRRGRQFVGQIQQKDVYPRFEQAFHRVPKSERRAGLSFLRQLMEEIGLSKQQHAAEFSSGPDRSPAERAPVG